MNDNRKKRAKLILELKEHLKFEELMSNLSSRFLALSTGEIDNAFNEELGRIGRHLGIDRIAFLNV